MLKYLLYFSPFRSQAISHHLGNVRSIIPSFNEADSVCHIIFTFKSLEIGELALRTTVRTAAHLNMGAGRDHTIHAAETLAQPCYPKSLNSGAPWGLKTGKTRQNVSYSYSSVYFLTEGHHQQH